MPANNPGNVLRGFRARLNGYMAEFRAKRFLSGKGLTFIQQNYRCKWGEIDLIFKDDQQIVFVEVKSRESDSHGAANEFYSKSKHLKLTRSIMTYLMEKGFNPEITQFRIDVIAITAGELQWLKSV